MTHHQELEQQALKLTILGNAGMVLLGVVFAVISSSEAILFDGKFGNAQWQDSMAPELSQLGKEGLPPPSAHFD